MTDIDPDTASPCPSHSPSPGGEAWPTDAHRRQLTESLERGWLAALAAYEGANARLIARRQAREAAAVADPGTAGDPAGADPDADARADKAILDEAKLTAAAKAALAGVEAAWRALALVRPAADARGADPRQADPDSLTESRRRLAAMPDGREAPAGPDDAAGEEGP